MKSKNKQNNKQREFDKILAQESPELFLKLKKNETDPHLPPPLLSGPMKLVIFISIVDIIVALLLSIINKTSYFQIWGSLGVVMGIPWWLAFLDGFIFLGYGIYVIKKKEGDLDIGSMSSELKTHQIEGDVASLLGLVYVLLGIFLIAAVVFRCLIQF
ncbi:MAG: hypothetical protein ABIG29_02950 [Candidatus Nealsonbacteria bacterium]